VLTNIWLYSSDYPNILYLNMQIHPFYYTSLSQGIKKKLSQNRIIVIYFFKTSIIYQSRIMSLTERIRIFRETIDQQNGMISTYQKEKSDNVQVIQALYAAVCKYKVEYMENVAPISEHAYPEMRMEEIRNLSLAQLVGRIGEALSTVCNSLGDTSRELRSAYHEMDMSMEQSLNQFRTLQASENATRKGQAFLNASSSSSSQARSQTPEIPMVSRPRIDSVSASTEDPVLSAPNKENKQQSPSGKSKAGTAKPLVDVLNSVTGAKGAKK